MPREVVANEDVREDSLSPPPHLDAAQLPEVSSDGKLQDVEYALDEEDEKEQSFSVPASPTLSRRPPPLVYTHGRVQRLRSQSFDDLLSSVNNEEDLPPSPSAASKSPVSHRTGRSIITFKLPPRLDSGSDSDTETVSVPQHRIGTAYNHSILVSSQPDLVRPSLAPQGPGKLNRLKGKFLQRVKRGQNQKLESLQVPQQQMQQHSDRPTSGSGSDAAQDAADDTSARQRLQVTHKLLAVGQRFRNSPSLLRRMGVGWRGRSTAQAPPISVVGGEGEDGERRREAREKSQSNFITL